MINTTNNFKKLKINSFFTILLIIIFFINYLFFRVENNLNFNNFSRVEFDPEMVYYSNAVSYLDGNNPYYIDHPGTPNIIFQSLIILITYNLNISTNKYFLVYESLINSDYYLHIIKKTYFFIFIILLIISCLYLEYKNNFNFLSLLSMCPLTQY